jgi:hypothetical protein
MLWCEDVLNRLCSTAMHDAAARGSLHTEGRARGYSPSLFKPYSRTSYLLPTLMEGGVRGSESEPKGKAHVTGEGLRGRGRGRGRGREVGCGEVMLCACCERYDTSTQRTWFKGASSSGWGELGEDARK